MIDPTDVMAFEPQSELPPVGARLGGRYRLDGLLARGGVGVVYVGRDVDTDRPVAVKVLPRSLDHGSKRERFLREARLAASVGHPHVVKVLDAGFYDETRPFLVMELLDGVSLHRRIHTLGVLKVADACSLASQLCAAAEAVHATGIVHRDLKPANVILIRALGITAKLIDFGMSKSFQDVDQITEPGRVMGTPSYLAPEVLLGKPADPRSDVYGIGATLYEALVGVPWVQSHRRIEHTLQAVLTKVPAPPSLLRPKIPAYVDELVLRACARAPEERYENCLEMKRACDEALNRAVKDDDVD
ncbi:MAG: serine/threonine protein kinase [Myxococcales bacterium]|nr:serine/threonine protein kinase [Myxococcales bacterium]